MSEKKNMDRIQQLIEEKKKKAPNRVSGRKRNRKQTTRPGKISSFPLFRRQTEEAGSEGSLRKSLAVNGRQACHEEKSRNHRRASPL